MTDQQRKVTGNLFAGLPDRPEEEWFETLARGEGAHIERIVSHGHASPPDFWYDQDHAEWVVLLRGGAVIAYEDGRRQELAPGDFVLIEANEKHRVEQTDPDTLWLAVHFGA